MDWLVFTVRLAMSLELYNRCNPGYGDPNSRLFGCARILQDDKRKQVTTNDNKRYVIHFKLRPFVLIFKNLP